MDSPKNPLVWLFLEFEAKRILCMINIWNIDTFEKSYEILCFYKFQVHGIALDFRKSSITATINKIYAVENIFF